MPVRYNALDAESLCLCQVRHALLEAEQLARITAASFIALQIWIPWLNSAIAAHIAATTRWKATKPVLRQQRNKSGWPSRT